MLFSLVLRRMFLASSAEKLSSSLILEPVAVQSCVPCAQDMSVLVFQICNLPAIGFLSTFHNRARQTYCAGKSDYRDGINL